jgi:multidrug efflux system outer membrane protein
VRAGQAADVAEWQAQGLEYNAAQTSLAAQIAKAWFALGETNEQVVLAQSALKIRKNTEEAIRDRFERALLAEGGTASQLRLAQVDVATAKAHLAQWQGERESALRQIELLAGRYPSGSDLSRKGLPALPGYPPAGLPSELLMRRPDVLAAERRFAATGERIREAKLAVFPSLKLNGAMGTSTDSLKDVLDSTFGVWSYGAAVSQPILTGGQLRAEQKAREDGEREALADLQQTVLTAFGEVEQALVADRYLGRRVAAFEEAATLANEAAKAAAEDFADGSEDVLTLLLALTRKIDSASALVTLRRLRLDNRINLHLALGGDFRLR